jgi:hypothetical protein
LGLRIENLKLLLGRRVSLPITSSVCNFTNGCGYLGVNCLSSFLLSSSSFLKREEEDEEEEEEEGKRIRPWLLETARKDRRLTNHPQRRFGGNIEFESERTSALTGLS